MCNQLRSAEPAPAANRQTKSTACGGFRHNADKSKAFVQVDQDVREARRDELVSLQQRVGEEFAESLVGRQVCHILSTEMILYVSIVMHLCILCCLL